MNILFYHFLLNILIILMQIRLQLHAFLQISRRMNILKVGINNIINK